MSTILKNLFGNVDKEDVKPIIDTTMNKKVTKPIIKEKDNQDLHNLDEDLDMELTTSVVEPLAIIDQPRALPPKTKTDQEYEFTPIQTVEDILYPSNSFMKEKLEPLIEELNLEHNDTTDITNKQT